MESLWSSRGNWETWTFLFMLWNWEPMETRQLKEAMDSLSYHDCCHLSSPVHLHRSNWTHLQSTEGAIFSSHILFPKKIHGLCVWVPPPPVTTAAVATNSSSSTSTTSTTTTTRKTKKDKDTGEPIQDAMMNFLPAAPWVICWCPGKGSCRTVTRWLGTGHVVMTPGMGSIWYPSSHNHGSVENGCISNIRFLSFRVIFVLNHDYGSSLACAQDTGVMWVEHQQCRPSLWDQSKFQCNVRSIYLFGQNYSDFTRPHPKWWLSKGNPLISGKSTLVKYYDLARYMCKIPRYALEGFDIMCI